MKIFLFLFFLFFSHLLLADSKNYLLVSDYLKIHSEQQKISKEFVGLVQNRATKLNTVQNKPINIVMVYPGNQLSDYWRRSKDSFINRLNEMGIQYNLEEHFTKPAVEIKEQAKYLLKSLNNQVDYLIFTLDANKHIKFVEKIISNKKPKLILQNITTPIEKFGERQPFLYVGFDHVIGATMLADYYIEKTQGKGKYAILYGSKGYVSYMRGDEFIEYISKSSKLQLVDSFYTDFDKEKAKKATQSILKMHKDIKFIYACSTDIALGAMEVLKEQNLTDKIMINGWGGGSSELDAIVNKRMDVTVMRMNDDNGVAMAEAIKLDLEKKSSHVPTIFSGDFVLVEKGIDLQILEQYKTRAFRYSK